MEILKIENLYSGYKNFIVLKNINLKITKGEFVGLIGPNASGKSTLFKTIVRILKIQNGKIFLYNKDIKKYKFKDLAKIVAFSSNITDYSLNFKVKEFLLLARYPWGFLNNNFDFILSEFELTELIYKTLKELSSGELQRVLIAQALLQTPELLLLDEPVSHLDIAHQIKILDKLKKFNLENKLTILASFHELNLASEYCDRLILLFNGEIKKQGLPSEVLDYKTIEEVYNTKVIIKENPISKKPYVFPVPIMWKNNDKKN
ncbi:MAG: ABC transporter ATP-binding protein [Endomicrobiia bacterium]